jgi:hypothetical protein
MRRRRRIAWKGELAKTVFLFGSLAAIWIAYKTGLILWMTTALITPIAHR